MKWSILTLALVLVLSGCKKDIQNEASVKAGILKYLATRTNLNEMDVAVTAISFRQHEADATVHFQAKGNSSPSAGLEIKYVLEQHGDEWAVKGRSGGTDHAAAGAGANPHGMGATLPPGHPSIPQNPAGSAK